MKRFSCYTLWILSINTVVRETLWLTTRIFTLLASTRVATTTTSILRVRAVPTPAALRDELEEMVVREVLDSLLLLNYERHEEVVKAGLFETKRVKGRKGRKGRQGMLF